MSRMMTELTALRPDWTSLPDELERAWLWMEEQGFGSEAPAGYVLSPYADAPGSAPAFVAGLTLEGWFEEGSEAHGRLLPIAEAAGDGSMIAAWRDEDDEVRFVLLGSIGGGYVLAEDARGLLNLLAVGYDELMSFNLGEPPMEPLPDEALAPLRAWLESEFGITAAQEWPAPSDDEFTAWVDLQLGGPAWDD